MLVPGLGWDVQAHRCRALRRRSASGPAAGVALRPARRGPSRTDRRSDSQRTASGNRVKRQENARPKRNQRRLRHRARFIRIHLERAARQREVEAQSYSTKKQKAWKAAGRGGIEQVFQIKQSRIGATRRDRDTTVREMIECDIVKESRSRALKAVLHGWKQGRGPEVHSESRDIQYPSQPCVRSPTCQHREWQRGNEA